MTLLHELNELTFDFKKDYKKSHKSNVGYQLTPNDLMYTILGMLFSNQINTRTKSFIDLGAGFGLFGKYLVDNKIVKSAEGIEYDVDQVKFAKEKLGIKILQGDISTLKKLNQDIIYTFNCNIDKTKMFDNIIKNMEKNQIFIESYDCCNKVYEILVKHNFSQILRCRGIVIGIK